MNIQSEISELYKEILFREPDDAGMHYYLTQVEKGNLTLNDVKESLCDSHEASVKNTKFLKYAPSFISRFSEEITKEMLQSVPHWYNTFKFRNLQTFPGRTPLNYQMWCAQGIPLDLSGKSVLDVGAGEGFYSFLCESRGAKKVLAIDLLEIEYRPKEKFDDKLFQMVKKILDSNVEYQKLSVYNVEKLNEKFDIILFFGLYYHLINPISAFNKLASITNETLFLAGHVIGTQEPIMYYYDLDNQNANTFSSVVASPQCLLNIGKRAGFKESKILDVMEMPITERFPHMTFGDTCQKVGTFEFSK